MSAYWMFKIVDGDATNTGDCGGMSMGIKLKDWDDASQGALHEHRFRPKIDWVMRVGSTSARSFSQQDWWQTTRIVEILEEDDSSVLFKTHSGSTYLWKSNHNSLEIS